MTFTTHRARMVAHFLFLDARDCAYAADALNIYRANPSCPCPDILRDIKDEQARRAAILVPVSPQPPQPPK